MAELEKSITAVDASLVGQKVKNIETGGIYTVSEVAQHHVYLASETKGCRGGVRSISKLRKSYMLKPQATTVKKVQEPLVPTPTNFHQVPIGGSFYLCKPGKPDVLCVKRTGVSYIDVAEPVMGEISFDPDEAITGVFKAFVSTPATA